VGRAVREPSLAFDYMRATAEGRAERDDLAARDATGARCIWRLSTGRLDQPQRQDDAGHWRRTSSTASYWCARRGPNAGAESSPIPGAVAPEAVEAVFLLGE